MVVYHWSQDEIKEQVSIVLLSLDRVCLSLHRILTAGREREMEKTEEKKRVEPGMGWGRREVLAFVSPAPGTVPGQGTVQYLCVRL